MGQFNANDYETVKSRKKRFYEKYPDGRILVELLHSEEIMEHALFKASLYKDNNDNIFATGYAHEIRDKEKLKNRYGKEYESVNYTSWCENCEESAIGRALDNAGFSGNNKCSREEMQKAQKQAQTIISENAGENIRYANALYSAITEPSEKLQQWISAVEYHSANEIVSGIKRMQKIIQEQGETK